MTKITNFHPWLVNVSELVGTKITSSDGQRIILRDGYELIHQDGRVLSNLSAFEVCYVLNTMEATAIIGYSPSEIQEWLNS